MATGDTHAGQIRIVREDAEGRVIPVLGPISQDRVDYFNNDVNAVEKLYVNTALSDRKAKPANAESMTAASAEFKPGEVLRVQHQANAEVANDIDVDADAFNIETMKRDMNRGTISNDPLTVADQELSTDPSESTDGWIDIYQYTVGDRKERRIVGSFEAVAVEN